MKVCDVINPYKAMVEHEMLEETRLSTAFKIGFELEGICDSTDPELRRSGYLPGYHSGRRPSEGSKALLDKLNKLLDMGKGTINSLTDTIGSMADEGDTTTFNIKGIPGKFIIKDSNSISYSADGSGNDTEDTGDVGDVRGNNIVFNNNFYHIPGTKKIPNNLSINSSKIESDSSLSTGGSNTTGHAWTFEWGSPIIPFNPTNINKIYKFLTSLKTIGVKTNESCGFHTHISYEDMTRDDAKWILFCIANDESLLNEVSYLQVPGEESIKFYGHYADTKWFDRLKAHGNLKNWSFRENTDDKYLQIRMHPGAGTLEWRGPRNFINDGSKPQLIKEYLTKLWKLVLKIGKLVDEKEYNGYKKSDVLAKMVVSGEFNTTAERLSTMNADKLLDLIKKKPLTLVSLKPSKLKSILDKSGRDIISYGSSSEYAKLFREAWSKIPVTNKEIIVDYAYREGRTDYLIDLCKNEGKVDTITTDILIKKGQNFDHTLRNLIENNLDSLSITKPETVEMIYNSGLPLKLIMKVIGKFPHLINLKILAEIANSNNRYILATFPELPVKIQRILIRKSPYNIQYINNPDQSIINELKKKYGEDLNDYILGVL